MKLIIKLFMLFHSFNLFHLRRVYIIVKYLLVVNSIAYLLQSFYNKIFLKNCKCFFFSKILEILCTNVFYTCVKIMIKN